MNKTVSIVKEVRPGERRVILLPNEVRNFRSAGFQVFVEEGAGEGIGISDQDYISTGADLVSAEDAWGKSNFVLKYKAPTPAEFKYLRNGLHLGAVFHAEGDQLLTQALCESGVTAYSYEFFKTTDGFFPLAVASSEIAGKLAVLYGAYYLQSHLGGSGVLLSNVVGAKPPKVLIIGHGNAGGAAARLANALGAEVVVLGRNPDRLRRFQATVPTSVKCRINSHEVLCEEVVDADLVIGAILISSYDTPAMIDENLIRKMKPGSVIVDVTCGYGPGYMPSLNQATTFDNPILKHQGVLYCKLDTLPAAVPVTTVQAVSALVGPYLLALGESIFDATITDSVSAAGKIVQKGRIVHNEVLRHMKKYSEMQIEFANM